MGFMSTRKVLLYILSIRWFEIGIRMGAPLLGALFAMGSVDTAVLGELGIGLLAYFFLWAHIYLFNELAGMRFDKYDEYKANTPLLSGQVSYRGICGMSAGFLLASVALYFYISPALVMVALVDVLLGFVYVHPRLLLKDKPLVSFLFLFLVSFNDFLLGWLLFSKLSLRGVSIAVYFGLLGIAGQHYHEVKDYTADKNAGIRTNAVRYGKKRIFLLGFGFYTLACVYLGLLALWEVVPPLVGCVPWITYPIYILIFHRCLIAGMDSLEMHKFVKRYRVLYIIMGIGMLIALFGIK